MQRPSIRRVLSIAAPVTLVASVLALGVFVFYSSTQLSPTRAAAVVFGASLALTAFVVSFTVGLWAWFGMVANWWFVTRPKNLVGTPPWWFRLAPGMVVFAPNLLTEQGREARRRLRNWSILFPAACLSIFLLAQVVEIVSRT